MPGVALQRSDERQVKFLAPGEKCVRRQRRLHARKPGGTALLDCLDGRRLPFLDFGRGTVGSHLRDGPLGKNRHDPMRAQFCGLLDDQLHGSATGDGLRQRHLTGQRRDWIFPHDLQRDSAATCLPHFTKHFISRAVQHDHPVARANPQNVQRVTRLSLRQ